MSGRHILKFFLIGALVLVLSLTLCLTLIDVGYFKPKVESAVTNATGRAFNINGELSLKILPRPHFILENATLAGPKWGSEAAMLSVGRVYVSLELLSLIRTPIVISELQIEDVKLLVESSADGTSNWQFPVSDEAEAPPEIERPEQTVSINPSSPLFIRSAKIKNIALNYRAAESPATHLIIKSLNIAPGEKPVSELEARILLNDIAVALSAEVSTRHTDLSATVAELKTQASLDYAENALAFDLELTTLADIGKLVAVDTLPDEKLLLKGALTLSKNKLLIDNFESHLGKTTLTAEGSYNIENSETKLALGLSADTLSAFEKTLPDIPFSVKTKLTNRAQKIELDPFSATLGESSLEGSAQITTGDRVILKLAANSEKLDLSPFEADDSQKASPPPSEETSTSQYVFTDEPLDLSGLQTLDADIDLNIKHLKTSSMLLEQLELEATLKKGLLDLTSRFSGEYGGQYNSTVKLDASQAVARLDVSSKVDTFKIGMLSGSEVPSSDIPETNITLDLSASGDSPRSLAASLNGLVFINQGPGKVNNALIEKFSGDIITQLFNTLNPFASKDKFTVWDCSIVAINFDSGLGEIDGFLLESEKLMVVAGGDVDLNTETLNFEFNTKPRKGVGVSADMFVTPFVKLSGTLAEPSIGLNKKGILLSGGAAVLTGGMSFLYTGLMDRAMAEGSRCEQVLTVVEKQMAARRAEKE